MVKFFAFALLCGLYQGNVQACISLQDTVSSPTRSACIARGQVLMTKAKSAAWYGGVKEPHQTRISCKTL